MEDVLKRIEDYALEEIMGERFGSYAKEIIQDRAIPDVRDGLKPVQRRILFAMYKAGWTYDKKYVKCAATVGDVLGKYHPHGDSSVYDAMVRMSQWWKQNAILVDMKGNNGSMDGDGAAAYRYTEARLAKISNELLGDLDKNTVKWAPNFDDRLLEPTVLPAKFPNLLVNGTMGISAGYATNIPPHNLGEIIDATIKRIDSPNCYLDTILDIVKGPDFPTGGIACGIDGIREAFKTGKGRVIVRCKYDIQKEKGKEKIVITEIPYDVNKALLVNRIDAIRIDKKIDGMAEVRDESDREGLRIVIDLKAGANRDLVLNYLFKNTDLQISYNYNMVAIVNRVPKTLGILEILDAYIAHQREVITERTKFDLAQYEKRMHIVEGLIKCLSILDQVIKTIRASKNKSDAINNLVKEYDFSGEQAKAIVELQLYRLTNTDVVELQEEMEKLKKLIEGLKAILSDEEVLKYVMKKELKILKKEYEIPRRTQIEEKIQEIKLDMKEMIPKENVVVVVTNEGYVKRVSSKSYAASTEDTTLKPGDFVTGLYECTTLDTIMIFTNLGNYLFIPVYKIPEMKWKELGKHVNNVVMLNTDEKVIASFIYNKKDTLVFASKLGMAKRTKMVDYEVARCAKPMVAMKLKSDDELVNVEIDTGNIVLVSENGYYLNFKSEELPIVGAKASGVKGINLKDDILVSLTTYNEKQEYITLFTDNKTAKRIKITDLERHTRAKKGSTILKKTKTVTYKVLNVFATSARDLVLTKADSEINIFKNSDITIMDLASTGSSISKYKLDLARKVSIKENIKEDKEIIQEEVNIEQVQEEAKVMSMEDFLDDFKI
ncbi:MAG: DNA topoisomerase IV subunit A [Bacilli bacterium]|jgi:topoisomerase-4 subunit A|nr:DNA topoisomerase IV subunit A [Bacilli bacterium]